MATAAKVLTLCEELLYSPPMKNALKKKSPKPKKHETLILMRYSVFSTLNRSIWH